MDFSDLVSLTSLPERLVAVLAFLVGTISFATYAFALFGAPVGGAAGTVATKTPSRLGVVSGGLGFVHCVFVLAGSLAALAASDPPIVLGAIFWIWMFFAWASIGITLGKGFPRNLLRALYQAVSPLVFVGVTLASVRFLGSVASTSWEVLLLEYILLLGVIYSAAVAATLVNQFFVYRVALDRASGADLKQTYTIGAVLFSPLLVAVLWIWIRVVPDVLHDSGIAAVVAWIVLVASAVETVRHTFRVLPDFQAQ